MRRLALVPALALAACPTTAPCPDVADAPVVAACFQPEGGWDEGFWMNQEQPVQEVEGTITSIEAGTVGACFTGGTHPGSDVDLAGADTVVLSIRDGDADAWELAFVLPDADPELFGAVDDEVTVRYHFRFGGFSPDAGFAHLYGPEGIVAAVAESGGLESIELPGEVTLSDGGAICSRVEDCGEWSRHDLTVDTTLDESLDAFPLGYGATVAAQEGDHRFVHAGFEVTDDAYDTCADWFVADLTVALYPLWAL